MPGDLFRRIVEGVTDYAIFMLDASGRIASWNAGAERIKGYEAQEVIGSHFSRFYPPEDVARGKPAWELAQAAKDGRVEDEGWRVRKDGTRFWASVVITALRDEHGTLQGFAKVTRDVTDRKRAEGERERLLRAQEAVQARDEFLAIASHELKTPITALQLQVQSLLRQSAALPGPPGQAFSKRLDAVMRQAERLTRLIDGFSDVVRVNTGALELAREPLDLSELVRTVLARWREELERNHCTVRLSAPAPVTGRFDRPRMEQVIASLLGNAVKYGAGKPVRLQVRAEEDRAILIVSDQGIGIPREFQSRVFDRFVRAVSTRHYGGFGLGLWMVVQIVRAHGGSVHLDSTPGEGSTFEVDLPRELDSR
ncbi:MAG TPA: PAS domain-containing sensor histidine kinase [Anaeromyxobacteraceae bacterium]|nr:PAS domain-containing sensor histidine kinase [Anaeromyxobacteraceae bacterium]